jgi:hypothetical protein
MKQSKLLEIKNSHPIMKNWSIFDFSTFIWRVNEARKNTKSSTKVKEFQNIISEKTKSELVHKSPASLTS